jgi:hypothetical protein
MFSESREDLKANGPAPTFFVLAVTVSFLSIFSACASAPPPERMALRPPPMLKPPVVKAVFYRGPEELARPLSEEEKSVIASAQTLIGRAPESKVVVNGRSFTLDCIGTVAAIYFKLGIDITKDFPRYSGNGVNRFYESLKARNALHRDEIPRPGDAIVWDNTWDANNDGKLDNDPHTHAAVVVAVEEDGTIHYVHEHVSRGVIVEVMNLKRPGDYQDEKGKLINSPLALVTGTGRGRPEHWLSGDLLNGFGDVLREKAYYQASLKDETEHALSRVGLAPAP